MTTADIEARMRNAAKSGSSDELSEQIKSIRDDLQSLRDTVSQVTQDLAREKWAEAEETIRRNPLLAVAIAASLGFLFGLMTRR